MRGFGSQSLAVEAIRSHVEPSFWLRRRSVRRQRSTMWVQDVSSWITPVPDGRPNSSVSDVSQGARALVLPLPRHRPAWELGRRLLIEHRDMAAAQAFFRSAQAVTGVTPDQVTTDGHDSYPSAIRPTLGRHVVHRTSTYKNNR